MAQARPRPLLDAQTMARRPLIPRSTVSLPLMSGDFLKRSDETTLAKSSGPDKRVATAETHIRETAPITCRLYVPVFLQAVDRSHEIRRKGLDAQLPGGR